MRFPRVVRVRWDKGVREANKVEDLREVVETQKTKLKREENEIKRVSEEEGEVKERKKFKRRVGSGGG